MATSANARKAPPGKQTNGKQTHGKQASQGKHAQDKQSHQTKQAHQAAQSRKGREGAPGQSTPQSAQSAPSQRTDKSKKETRISTAEFTAGAQKREHIPAPTGPEIAFAGRSNVGKSSLLNMMLARKGLARTSRTPGCTRQINFFDVAVASGPKLVFVDLPGYGYAKVSKAESRDWKKLLEDYLFERTTLEAVVVLVDARRGVEQDELDLFQFLQQRGGLPVFIAVTKLDKLSRSAQKPRLVQIEKESGVKVVGTSAETGAGREELWGRLLNVATHRLDEHAGGDLV